MKAPLKKKGKSSIVRLGKLLEMLWKNIIKKKVHVLANADNPHFSCVAVVLLTTNSSTTNSKIPTTGTIQG